MKNFHLASIVLIAVASAAVIFGSVELSVSATAVAAATAASALAQGTPSPSIHDWTGVWKITTPGKPGGVLNIADDAGPSGTSLSGVIVFYVNDRETGQRIGIEPRTMVNPHIEGNTLVFQVRRILKPHLRDEAPDQPLDPTDIAAMKLTLESANKAVLTCAKCGDGAPTELEKME